MDGIDFPTWVTVGSYGGVACSLFATAFLASYALGRRRGTPHHLVRATLTCLAAGALMLAPILWIQARLDVYGPSLGVGEVALVLGWCAIIGWCLPLGMLVSYVAAADLQPAGMGLSLRHRAVSGPARAALDDPRRRIEPLGGRAWGQLLHENGTLPGRALPLTRALTLLGREADNDIMVDELSASRYHAEIRWDHGHPQLLDRGSMNGTFVNQQVVRGSVPLRSGDIVEISGRRYRFELLDTGVPARDPAPPAPEEATRKVPGLAAEGYAPGVAPALVLVGLDHGFVNERWELREAVAILGRERGCQIYVPDLSISRAHAQIVRQQTGYFVTDLGSSNGTYLNGERLTAPRALQRGDVLRAGEVSLGCELTSSLPTQRPVFSAPTHDLAHDFAGDLAVGGGAKTAPPPRTPSTPIPAGASPAPPEQSYLLAPPDPATRRDRPRLGPPRLRPSREPASEPETSQ